MTKRGRQLAVAAVLALALVLGLYLLRDGIRRPFGGGSGGGLAYLGSAACAECHAPETEAWRVSHHALAMQAAAAGTVLGDFDNAVFVQGPDTTRFFRAEGGYWVRATGEDGEPADFRVAHVFGVYPLQQYLLELSRGRLQSLPVAWDTRSAAEGGQRWFSLYPDEVLRPGDPLHWTGGDQNWNYMCAECHVTDFRKGYDEATASYESRYAEAGVGCESCHGPGEAHARWAKGGGGGRDTTMGLLVRFRERREAAWIHADGAPIATRVPSAGPRDELPACAACHSRRRVVREGRLPNEPLLDTHVPEVLVDPLYFADGGIHGEVYEYGSFLQSRMYAAGVTCSDCHDPHRLGLRAEGNALCAQCHAPARYDAPSHHFHEAGTEGSLCVSCHMPERTYMGVDDRRDHSFRVPHPELTATTGSPNACNVCHTDRNAAWAAQEIARRRSPEPVAAHRFATALHAGESDASDGIPLLVGLAHDAALPGIVRATAVRLLSGVPFPVIREATLRHLASPDPLLRLEAVGGAAALDPALKISALEPLLTDRLLAIRMAAARALAAVPADQFAEATRPAFEAALSELVAAERLNADRPEAHLNLGNLSLDLGRQDEAEAEYGRALAIDPTFAPAAVNWADLLRLRRQDARAESLLTAFLGRVPDSPDALFARGLARVRLGKGEEARADLRAAARGRPEDARLQTVYALALHAASETDAALAVLRDAFERRPGNPGVLYILATLHRDLGRRDEARRYAALLLQLDGGNPVAQNLVAELGRAGGSSGGPR